MEENEVNTVENAVKARLNLKKVIITAAVVIAALFIAVRLYHVFFSSTGGRMIGASLGSVGYEQGDKADFFTTDEGIYFVTKDGVIFMNEKGSAIKWQDTYTMMNPTVQGDDEIIGVAEQGGTALSIYSPSGNLYKINADAGIVSFAVNKKGGSALITETDTEYTITVYTESGFNVFMAKNPIDEGLPVGCDLSDDGKYLAVSYVYTGYTELETRVVFYNLNQTADSSLDEEKEMVASFIREGEVIGIIRFMNGDNLIGVSSSEVVCVKLGVDGSNVKCTELWSMQNQNSIKAMTLVGKKYIALAYGEKNLNAANAEEDNTVAAYDLNGKLLFKEVMEKDVDGLCSNSSTVIVKMGRSFKAFDKKGRRVLSYTVAQDVNKLLLYEGNSRAIVVTPKEAYIMEVKSKGINTMISNIRSGDDEIGAEKEEEITSEELEGEEVSENEEGAENAEETEVTEVTKETEASAETEETEESDISEE